MQTKVSTIKKRGFASMSPEKQRMIASSGGKKAQKLGKSHKFTREEAIAAGKIGGKARRDRKIKQQNSVGSKEERA